MALSSLHYAVSQKSTELEPNLAWRCSSSLYPVDGALEVELYRSSMRSSPGELYVKLVQFSHFGAHHSVTRLSMAVAHMRNLPTLYFLSDMSCGHCHDSELEHLAWIRCVL